MIPTAWLVWLKENLDRIDAPSKESLIETMRKQINIPSLEIELEIQSILRNKTERLALSSSFVEKKARWVQALLVSLDSLQTEKLRSIDERSEFPPYSDFIRDYVSQSKPLIIRRAIEKTWPVGKWTLSYLQQNFGNLDLEVQIERDKDVNFELNSTAHKKKMRFSEFLQSLEKGNGNAFYMTANNATANRSFINGLLKELPNIKGSDGSAYFDHKQFTERGFVWVGSTGKHLNDPEARGSITPLHHDLTQNFFVQMVGEKRWRMAPPTVGEIIGNDFHVYTQLDIRKPNYEKYPRARQIRWADFVLKPGDSLYIPQGWYHAVESLPIDNINCSVTLTCFNPPVVHFPNM